ncbi:MAG: 5-amino-6-(D-ribitylamino)uracil--L-tyrosine 4-hydroxyphenyl transferase CofH [Candidatus Hadarchaeales archaeon]
MGKATGVLSKKIKNVGTRGSNMKGGRARGSSALEGRWEKRLAEIDPLVAGALDRSLSGKSLSLRETAELLRTEGRELQLLLLAADLVRRGLVGEVATYVVNRNINHTNICTGSCRFCAFRRPPSHPEAYSLTPQQLRAKVEEAVRMGATEICLQGGLHPDFGLETYLDLLRIIRGVSEELHIHAFSPAELDHLSRKEGMSVDEVLKPLKEAGLNSVPGTAAEILSDRVREIICPTKIKTKRWVEIVKTCHRRGIPTTSTMMYGTVETPEERAGHLLLLREIQKETGGFTEFVPLPLVPKKTELYSSGITGPTIRDNLRTHAVARLALAGYINHVQASWVKLGPEGACAMLMAGADDLGGTLFEENITREAGGEWGQGMTPHQLRLLILRAGRIPRQRSTLYELLD